MRFPVGGARNDGIMTIETIDNLIVSSRPRRGLLRGSRPLLLGVGLILGMYLADPHVFGGGSLLSLLLPQIAIVALAGLIVATSLYQRRRGRLMLASFEALQLRQWEAAADALTRLLRKPVRPAQARAEALLGLASVAESQQEHENAQRIYEAMLAEHAADPLQLHTAQVALGATMLRTGQTTDAVDLIDRLTRTTLPGALRAQVEMLSLFREVTMGQAADAIEKAEERRGLFRLYLSTRAGFGYGLLAAAFDRANDPEKARRYWRDATLLVRPEELLGRFGELAPVAERYPATGYPL